MTEISKTQIDKRMKKKTNVYLAETIKTLKRTNPEIAKILAFPRRNSIKLNLEEIDKAVKEGEKILIPGKILSVGELTKKIRLVAWNISEKAKEKLKTSKSEFILLVDEIKKNPELKELKILK